MSLGAKAEASVSLFHLLHNPIHAHFHALARSASACVLVVVVSLLSFIPSEWECLLHRYIILDGFGWRVAHKNPSSLHVKLQWAPLNISLRSQYLLDHVY